LIDVTKWVYSFIYRLDRRKCRKTHKWNQYHAKYIKHFKACVQDAHDNGWGHTTPHNPIAHDNYVRWLQNNSRLYLCKAAFGEEILEEPLEMEQLVDIEYNKHVREGHRIPMAGQVNFAVCVTCLVLVLPLVPLV
jgi:hypothetical protein